MYVGSTVVAPGVGQTHDYNPGIAPSGLFWTMPIPDADVSEAPDLSTASYHMSNQPMPDYFSAVNALVSGPSMLGKVSFSIAFTATAPKKHFVDKTHDFLMDYRIGKATVAWKGSTGDFSFVSDPKSSKTIAAMIATERNGVFAP